MSTPAAPGEHHAHGETANPKALIITFLALTFGVVFVVLVLAVYHNSYTDSLKSQKQEGWTPEARETFSARQGQLTYLSTFGESNGTFHIPVDVAAEKVVAEYQAARDEGLIGFSQISEIDAGYDGSPADLTGAQGAQLAMNQPGTDAGDLPGDPVTDRTADADTEGDAGANRTDAP